VPKVFKIGMALGNGVINMTAKEYLQRAYRLDKLIESEERELSRLRALSERVNAPDMSRERVTGGEAGNKRENIILKMIEQEKRINDTIEQLVEVRADIRAKIELVNDDTQRLLLVYRYIDHMTWESIAEKIHYTYQWVHKLHARALRSFENILKS